MCRTYRAARALDCAAISVIFKGSHASPWFGVSRYILRREKDAFQARSREEEANCSLLSCLIRGFRLSNAHLREANTLTAVGELRRQIDPSSLVSNMSHRMTIADAPCQ